ncbi:hypothetical protein AB0A77_37110 [Streptomyces varsoviensis]
MDELKHLLHDGDGQRRVLAASRAAWGSHSSRISTRAGSSGCWEAA